MALILNIDCAIEDASVCLAENETVLAFEQSAEQKNHASFLQPAIKRLMQAANKNFNELDAVAVTIGPGSYTGLRVGLASAKGLCYALNKPLIALNTLEVMTKAAIGKFSKINKSEDLLFCPMIDARRMEVYTALYDISLNNISAPCAMILDENSFDNELKSGNIVFFGNGCLKLKHVTANKKALFSDTLYDARDLLFFSMKFFNQKKFEKPAYASPFYLKDFFTPAKKK